ncbi:MAG: hypothetical protein K2K71_02155, partial [Eubacterium sp.]|nr:hypothetical protein [Eubacterium sp.]
MKRVFSMFLAAVAAMCGILGTLTAYGASESQLVPLTSVPYLETIAFNNAEIDGGFQKNKTLYTITLDESSVSPTLKSYDINGDADIFVTYNYAIPCVTMQQQISLHASLFRSNTLEMHSAAVRFASSMA